MKIYRFYAFTNIFIRSAFSVVSGFFSVDSGFDSEAAFVSTNYKNAKIPLSGAVDDIF